MLIKDTVRTVVMGYARKGLNGQSYFTHNDNYTLLSVITMGQGRNTSFISLLVRIVPDMVIIERDQNDKPLVDALIQSGISRSKIILAYVGDPVPQIT